MTDANLAKPQAFETKQGVPGYAPAPVPEFHQQTREPGYANSAGPDGDGGGSEWATSTAADGVFTADQKDTDSDSTDAPAADSSGSGKSSGGTSTASGGTRTKAASTSSK